MHGIVLIHGLGTLDAALDLATELGDVIEPGFAMTPSLHDGKVYSIEVRNSGRGVVDEFGHIILSTTNRPFELHTDGYNRRPSPHFVVLLRSDTSNDHPLTHLADTRQTIQRLDASTIMSLAEERFPCAHGLQSVLSAVGHQYVVRLNREEISRWSDKLGNVEGGMSAEHRLALDAFASELASDQAALSMTRGDCLVLDNTRVCHGRSALARDSERTLKRIWIV